MKTIADVNIEGLAKQAADITANSIAAIVAGGGQGGDSFPYFNLVFSTLVNQELATISEAQAEAPQIERVPPGTKLRPIDIGAGRGPR